MDREKIMEKMTQHLEYVESLGVEWVGLFLQGSQNYGLDTENSDVDTKAIVLPSLEQLAFNKKPLSYTHVMEDNSHCDVKDLRLYFDCFKKGNVNFVEILFTDYFILNPKYMGLWNELCEYRENIARYNRWATLNAMLGMMREKRKQLFNPSEGQAEEIERHGYARKQLHHIMRLDMFIKTYSKNVLYAVCLKSSWFDEVVYNMMMQIKVSPGYFLPSQAEWFANYCIEAAEQAVNDFMSKNPQEYDEVASAVLYDFQYKFIKMALQSELEIDR